MAVLVRRSKSVAVKTPAEGASAEDTPTPRPIRLTKSRPIPPASEGSPSAEVASEPSDSGNSPTGGKRLVKKRPEPPKEEAGAEAAPAEGDATPSTSPRRLRKAPPPKVEEDITEE